MALPNTGAVVAIVAVVVILSPVSRADDIFAESKKRWVQPRQREDAFDGIGVSTADMNTAKKNLPADRLYLRKRQLCDTVPQRYDCWAIYLRLRSPRKRMYITRRSFDQLPANVVLGLLRSSRDRYKRALRDAQ